MWLFDVVKDATTLNAVNVCTISMLVLDSHLIDVVPQLSSPCFSQRHVLGSHGSTTFCVEMRFDVIVQCRVEVAKAIDHLCREILVGQMNVSSTRPPIPCSHLGNTDEGDAFQARLSHQLSDKASALKIICGSICELYRWRIGLSSSHVIQDSCASHLVCIQVDALLLGDQVDKL